MLRGVLDVSGVKGRVSGCDADDLRASDLSRGNNGLEVVEVVIKPFGKKW
jgi:hypothetical protein